MPTEKLIGHKDTNRSLLLSVRTTRVRYREQIHLKNLYIMLHEYFIDEGWVDRKDTTWPEHFYLLRDDQKHGKEHWIYWRFKKVPHSGDNSYYRFLLDLFWHVNGAKDIEVIHQGQKFKTNHADLEIEIHTNLEFDYKYADDEKKKAGWRGHWLLKHFHEMYHKRIFKGELDIHKHHLTRETYKLQEVIKTWLKMRLYMPEKEGSEFWPELGVGDKQGLDVK